MKSKRDYCTYRVVLQVALTLPWIQLAQSQSPVAIELTEADFASRYSKGDLVIGVGEDCGRAAFRAAGPDICNRPTFETMMPVALLWINCYRTALQVKPISCGKSRSGKLVKNKETMAACRNDIEDRQFATLFQFTMLAMKSCKSLSRLRADQKIRQLVDSIIESSKENSINSAQSVEEYAAAIRSVNAYFSERGRDDLQASLIRQEDLIRRTSSLQNTFRRAALEFKARVDKANKDALALEPKVSSKLLELEHAIHTVESNAKTYLRQVEKGRAEALKKAKWERVQFAFLISNIMILTLSIRDGFYLFADAWTTCVYFGSWVTIIFICIFFADPLDDYYRNRLERNRPFTFNFSSTFNAICLSNLAGSVIFGVLGYIAYYRDRRFVYRYPESQGSEARQRSRRTFSSESICSMTRNTYTYNQHAKRRQNKRKNATSVTSRSNPEDDHLFIRSLAQSPTNSGDSSTTSSSTDDSVTTSTST